MAEESKAPNDVTDLVKKAEGKQIKDLLTTDAFKAAVAQSLPRHLSAERFIRVAITSLTRVLHLKECTYESFFKCLLDLSSLGLEPDGRRAHLIPYWNSKLKNYECSLIVDYKGIAELVRRSGEVANIHCDVVYEGDDFSFQYGSGAFLKHTPDLNGPRKVRKAAYSFVELKDGSEDFIVWGMSQVEAIKARSKAKDNGPWNSTPGDYDEMAKKSVFRNHSKWLPISAELREKIERDDDNVAIDTTGIEITDQIGSSERARATVEEKKEELRKAGAIINELGHHHATDSKGESGGGTPGGSAQNSAATGQPATETTGKQEPTAPEQIGVTELVQHYCKVLGVDAVEQISLRHNVVLPFTEETLKKVMPDLEKAIEAAEQKAIPSDWGKAHAKYCELLGDKIVAAIMQKHGAKPDQIPTYEVFKKAMAELEEALKQRPREQAPLDLK